MVTDTSGLGDKSFNDSAYSGLLRAKARLGASIRVVQSKSAADFQPNLTTLAEDGDDEIFAVEYQMQQDLDQIARSYPQNHFAIVDASVDAPNVTSITFREQEGSFLAGALAAMMSKHKTVAFLGGKDVPVLRRFEAGFTAGAHQIDPKTQVLVKYVGSFNDVASGKELAHLLLNDKADVLFVAAGKSGLGAIEALREQDGVYGIGVDSDQDGLAPGKVLTSVLKRVDNAVFEVARELHAHEPLRKRLDLGLKEDGVGLTPFTYTKQIIGEANLARLAKLRQAVITGKVVPPSTREQLALFRPVPM